MRVRTEVQIIRVDEAGADGPGDFGGPRGPGILLVEKPSGPTSHDVVSCARHALGIRRIGHTGTLDPFASGLLVLCVGSATRLAALFDELPKRYDAEVVLGVETTTHDRDGEVAARSESWREVDRDGLESALSGLRGEIRQRPPAYSAVRLGGRRAYELARAGRPPKLDARTVHVHRLEATAFEPPRIRLGAVVSTGTYVRALARDLGRALGCGAHVEELRRMAIGPFDVEDAVPLETLGSGDDLPPRSWREPASALAWLPARELDAAEVERVRTGRSVPRGALATEAPPTEALATEDASTVALVHGGRLLAIGELDGDTLRPRKVFDAR